MSLYNSKAGNLKLIGIGLSCISRAKGEPRLELSSASFDFVTSFYTSSSRLFTCRSCIRSELVESDDSVSGSRGVCSTPRYGYLSGVSVDCPVSVGPTWGANDATAACSMATTVGVGRIASSIARSTDYHLPHLLPSLLAERLSFPLALCGSRPLFSIIASHALRSAFIAVATRLYDRYPQLAYRCLLRGALAMRQSLDLQGAVIHTKWSQPMFHCFPFATNRCSRTRRWWRSKRRSRPTSLASSRIINIDFSSFNSGSLDVVHYVSPTSAPLFFVAICYSLEISQKRRSLFVLSSGVLHLVGVNLTGHLLSSTAIDSASSYCRLIPPSPTVVASSSDAHRRCPYYFSVTVRSPLCLPLPSLTEEEEPSPVKRQQIPLLPHQNRSLATHTLCHYCIFRYHNCCHAAAPLSPTAALGPASSLYHSHQSQAPCCLIASSSSVVTRLRFPPVPTPAALNLHLWHRLLRYLLPITAIEIEHMLLCFLCFSKIQDLVVPPSIGVPARCFLPW
ncbi:hypothetical protein B296_00035441 [Ensete ventricosum]|uniref:Uncharacterized protein n=1 Tax=Ensete ventricosum TaxID=4639 RepID=A0A426YWZ5_ENSVE|nr:hypothetical protein B296_00035441 [Ensete ventricosum]